MNNNDKSTNLDLKKLSEDSLNELDAYRKGLDTYAIISRTDSSGKIKYINKNFCKISKYSDSELIGENHRIIKSSIHSESFFKNMWDTINSGQIWRGEIRNKAKDGRLYWVDTTILPLSKNNGTVDYMSFGYDITAKKEAELLYDETQKIAKIGGWDLNINTMESSWTEGTYAIHEIEPGLQLKAEDGISYYAEHERDRIRKCVQDCIEKGLPFSSDFEFITAKGNQKWVHSKGFPEYDNRGKVARLLGTFQDITDRKNLEFSLLKKNEEFERAQKIAQLGSWSFDIKSQKISWSSQMFNIFPENLEDGEPSFEKHRASIHPEDVGQWEKMVQASITDGSKCNLIFRTHAKGNKNKWIWIETIGQATKNSLGEVIKLSGTCQNITDKVLREKELSFILGNSKIGLWRFNPTTQELDWDQSMFDLYEVEKEGFSGVYEAWEATLDESSKEEAVKDFADALAGDGHFESLFKVKSGAGKIKYIGARAVIDRDESGNATFVTGMNWDRTAEQEAVELANHQMKIVQHNAKLASIGELAAGVGHEINNPLAIIKGYVETLEMGLDAASSKLEPKKVQSYLNKINIATDRIASIAKGLRTFSRSDNSEEFDFDPVDAVNESFNMVCEIYVKHGIDFTINSRVTKSIAIKANRGKFQQILMNLFSNAKDSLRKTNNKEITIDLWCEENQLKIIVKDSGEGIPDHALENIFNPFFTTKGVNQGTGIGLALVHSFVEEMNGTISVKTQLDKGSEFLLQLPIEYKQILKDEPEAKSNQSNIEPVYDITVLVVDDEEEIRSILSFILKRFKINVIEAKDGEHALSIYKQNHDKIDLIISDMQMPKLNGDQLLEKVRSSSKLNQPKFIFITGGINIDLESKSEGQGKSYDGYLFKPFKSSAVQDMLEKLF